MKVSRFMILMLCLLVPALVRAEPAAATAWKPTPIMRWRKTAVGLLIGGAVSLALGATFTVLASRANSDALADMTYHPTSEDSRTSYEIAAGAFYTAGGAAMFSGVVLLW